MSFDYNIAAREICPKQISLLKEYYFNWKGDFTIDLKFRYVKIFGFDITSNNSRWILLDRFVNKRRIPNHLLPKIIIQLFEKKFVPIRLFQSVCEWLSPNDVYQLKIKNPRMIKSGIFPLENDDSLENSINCAKQLDDKISNNKYYVYSGNKSIHLWWMGFKFEEYLTKINSADIWKYSNREKMENRARKIAFTLIQNKVSFELDRRNAVDTRRVVPIIGTINGFTGRKVSLLNRGQLRKISPKSLMKETIIENWI